MLEAISATAWAAVAGAALAGACSPSVSADSSTGWSTETKRLYHFLLIEAHREGYDSARAKVKDAPPSLSPSLDRDCHYVTCSFSFNRATISPFQCCISGVRQRLPKPAKSTR